MKFWLFKKKIGEMHKIWLLGTRGPWGFGWHIYLESTKSYVADKTSQSRLQEIIVLTAIITMFSFPQCISSRPSLYLCVHFDAIIDNFL